MILILLILLICNQIFCKNLTIIAASKHENVVWLNKFKDNYDVRIYRPNEIGYKYTTLYEKGFEVVMYLKYIIDNYHNLSDYNIFIHAHLTSWHSRNMSQIIPRLNNASYHNLNIDYFQKINIQNSKDYKNIIDELTTIVYNKTIPYVNGYCCAQFIVSKENIQKHKLNIYRQLDFWLYSTKQHNHYSSRAFEYLWSYILGGAYDLEPYENGLCSIINCTESELKDKNMNFKLKFSNNVWYSK